MNIGDPKYITKEGYPFIKIEIDGIKTLLGEQKLTLLEKYNAVFLGSEFEDTYFVDIPADPADSRGAERLHGFTDDPEIVKIYRDWEEWRIQQLRRE